jgi:alpha-N-arabinofuranosidase
MKTSSDIPYLDVTAVANDSAKTLVVNVVNRHETNAITAAVVLQSGEFTGSAAVKQINAESVTSVNTRTNEAVAITSKEIKFQGSKISYGFPAHSFTQLLLPVK